MTEILSGSRSTMSLTSSESASTGTVDSSASKNSLSLSGQYGSTPPLPLSASNTLINPYFTNRRTNIKFSSARFNPTSRSLRSTKRVRGMSSFGRSTRRTSARPARTKGIFDNLLLGLADGVEAVKGCVVDMKEKLHGTTSRANYYMDFEKQVKILERKVRTLEVHRDRIEEMRDEYVLKMKLREGAFNIAQALSNQTSRAAKDKLQEARLEQRDLLEDLCDIEDELETKLGVFNVHINELSNFGRAGSGGDVIETQFKLGSQKWKAKCRICRHEQIWQDGDIIFLGKVMDELFVKTVEVKKIQGNVLLGNMKCQTREFFSFYPLTVTFDFPTSSAKLSMDVRWSPTIGEDFLCDLNLKTVQCIVSGAKSAASRIMGVGSVERLSQYSSHQKAGQRGGQQHIKIITEPDEDLDTQSDSSYGHAEVKTQSQPKSKKNRKKTKKDDSDFVYMDRQTIIDSWKGTNSDSQQLPSPPSSLEYPTSSSDTVKVLELCSSSKKPHHLQHPLQQGSRDSSLGSSSGSGRSLPRPRFQRTPEMLTLLGMLEAVFITLDEPKELYPELRPLEIQLTRLEAALKGGRLVKAPSMTLSESLAMDQFEFLGSEDSILASRFSSRNSTDAGSEKHSSSCRHSNSARNSNQSCDRSETSSNSISTPTSSITTPTSETQELLGTMDGFGGSMDPCEMGVTDVEGGRGPTHGSTKCPAVDRALLQHLIHCEHLLMHLQSSGPLKHKLTISLQKLQREAEIISDLLNIAAESIVPPQVDQILPELAADDQLMGFWRQLVAKDDILSVNYEQFAVGLDEHYGHSLWDEFPEMANKVLTELILQILGLEAEDWELEDGQMVVTVFQYSSYFLEQGSKGIPKCLLEVAKELKVTEGLETGDDQVKKRIASQLPDYGYNKGAFLAAAHLLSDSSPVLQQSALSYVGNFTDSSPWHSKAVQCFIELLEHSDQKVRIGACNALAKLEAVSAASQLKYLSGRDFSPVREAASKALHSMGICATEGENGDLSSTHSLMVTTCDGQGSSTHTSLQRTRSAEFY